MLSQNRCKRNVQGPPSAIPNIPTATPNPAVNILEFSAKSSMPTLISSIRFLIIDDVVYVFVASLKDAGKKLFAYIRMQETSATDLLNIIR